MIQHGRNDQQTLLGVQNLSVVYDSSGGHRARCFLYNQGE